MNPPPTPGGRSRPTDGKRFWRPVGGRPCPAERWPPHLGSRRPEVTLRPAVSTRSADRRRLLTMEPVNRRTLDWIYSLVSLGSGGVSRWPQPRPGGEGPRFPERPQTPKPIPWVKDFSPRLRLFLGTRSSATYVRAAGCARHRDPIVSFINVILTLATHTHRMGAGQKYHSRYNFLLLLPLFHFLVAPCDRITLLGICHLCINSSRPTTAKKGIPRQNLWDEWKFVMLWFNYTQIVLYLMLIWLLSRFKSIIQSFQIYFCIQSFITTSIQIFQILGGLSFTLSVNKNQANSIWQPVLDHRWNNMFSNVVSKVQFLKYLRKPSLKHLFLYLCAYLHIGLSTV